jgi:hypothetical protein
MLSSWDISMSQSSYDRTHAALATQLRAAQLRNDSSLFKAVLADLERLALEDAIQEVEMHCRKLAELGRSGGRPDSLRVSR